jgi:stage II sporulation protein D
MKKIITFTLIIIIIPFFIIAIYNLNKVEEIELNYINNLTIRVKRLKTDTIDVIPLESYIVGVLAGEMPIYFEKEALKAQAVASRSYAIKRIEYNKDKEYDVVDSIMNQVYLDEDYLKEAWGNNYIVNINKLRSAVNETLDECLTYNDKVIDALFFSTSNGYTEDADLVFNLNLPYLKSVESKWDEKESSAYSTTTVIPLNKFYEKLNINYNKELKVEIIKRSPTNRVLELKINNQKFTGKDLYNSLSLRSTDFVITQIGTNVFIDMKGYGHGVGMSQYGALGMAKEGYSYKEILRHYYQNTIIKKYNN